MFTEPPSAMQGIDVSSLNCEHWIDFFSDLFEKIHLRHDATELLGYIQ